MNKIEQELYDCIKTSYPNFTVDYDKAAEMLYSHVLTYMKDFSLWCKNNYTIISENEWIKQDVNSRDKYTMSQIIYLYDKTRIETEYYSIIKSCYSNYSDKNTRAFDIYYLIALKYMQGYVNWHHFNFVEYTNDLWLERSDYSISKQAYYMTQVLELYIKQL